MTSFVYIALLVFLGTVAVQGYGPKINRKPHEGLHKPHRPHNRPSQESHHGPPQRPHHHGFPHHWPSHEHNSGPPHQHGYWDNSPVWGDRSDSSDSSDDSSSPEDSYGPYDYSHDRDSADQYDSSEDSDDWFGHNHPKHPCKHPHTKKPPKPTYKPTPKPIPTTPEPIPTTHRIPFPLPTLPPHPDHTRLTPTPTRTTAAVRPDPTTPQSTPRPTSTVRPIPSPPTTASRPTWHPTPTTEDTTHWETTTNSVPETITPNPDIETTTTIEEAGFPTISPEIQQCIDLCLSTPEYNPVCGSNGETYVNEGKLFCAAACGVNVTLRRRSVCPPPNWDYIDEDGGETTGTATTPAPTTNTTPYVGRTTSLNNYQRCMKQCRITASFTPVCGSDLVTYMNIDRLKCAQSCGEVVEVLCEKPCAACGFNPVTPKTTTTTMRTTTTQIGRSTLEPDIQECIKACPVTPEYNPVCGSNHVTYSNPGRLLCAQLCGVAVSITRLGPCGLTTTSTTTTQAPPTTRSPDVLSCIRRCPVTSEYDPVCGSDGLTYSNLGNLECAKFCGVEVDFKHKSRCVDEFDLGPDEGTTSQTTQDINGNKDPATTPSRNTASTTSLFTSPTTTTKKPTTPSTTPKSTKNPNPNSSTTLGFTIPNDVLVDIFGTTTTQVTITKPTNPDEDEDLDLDARFNNNADTNDKETSSSHYSKIIFPD